MVKCNNYGFDADIWHWKRVENHEAGDPDEWKAIVAKSFNDPVKNEQLKKDVGIIRYKIGKFLTKILPAPMKHTTTFLCPKCEQHPV